MTQLSNVLVTDNSTIKTNYRWSKHPIIVSFLRQIYGLLVFSVSPIDSAFWCFLFCFFTRFARFQILKCETQFGASFLYWIDFKRNIYWLLRSASHRIQFCESCEPLTEVAEPEVDDLAAAIPEARALKELPPNMVFDLSLSLPIMR